MTPEAARFGSWLQFPVHAGTNASSLPHSWRGIYQRNRTRRAYPKSISERAWGSIQECCVQNRPCKRGYSQRPRRSSGESRTSAVYIRTSCGGWGGWLRPFDVRLRSCAIDSGYNCQCHCPDRHCATHILFQPALMTNTIKGKSTSRSSTPEKQRIQRLLDNPPSHKTIQSEVQLMVDHGNIQTFNGLGAGDRARFVEIIDQVSACHPGPLLRGRF